MLPYFHKPLFAAFVIISFFLMCISARAQSAGNSTSVVGTVSDPSGAVVPNATVEIHNPVSGFQRTATTDASGRFAFPNVPFNPYHLAVTAQGFPTFSRDIDVRSVVPVSVDIGLKLESSESVTVESSAADLLENDPTFHTDVDKGLFDKLPLESQSSSISSLVTLAAPGNAADSNGMFHGLGDHAENSFSVDNQPITDQFSKTFSNQIPVDAVQSLEVITGAPPAEFGDKTSMVINVTTRSGQGMTTPHGSVSASYGSFGTANTTFDLAYGGTKWGNFISVSGLNTGRFLDPPEFVVMHAKGNQENLFDRVDYQFSTTDSIHLNVGVTRSWFQNPNSFDGQVASAWNGAIVSNGGLGPDGLPVGPTDQRSQIKTFNIAPSWTRLISNTTAFTLGAFVRRDQYNYYPSANPFADLAPDLQAQSVGQNRTLTNAGIRPEISYVKGIHNLKVGAVYQQTFLNENDTLGIVDPTFNAPCLDSNGNPFWSGANPSSPNDPSQCAGMGLQTNNGVVNPNIAPFNPLLGCYDLSRLAPSAADACPSTTSGLFAFHGHTDVKELALYARDIISVGNWSLNLGLRGDFYNGLVTHREAEPRLGIAYNIKASNTVLRVSYARVLETPFNENLVLSSIGCDNAVLNPLLGCAAPVAWDRSKIPGFAGSVKVPNFHGFTALMVFSSVAARYFTPQLSGAGATPLAPAGVFRIDHDEKFNETTHLQYQPWKRGPWAGFNWRYDSGLVAGSVPFATETTTPVDLTGLSADQQLQAGLFCGSQHPTLASPLTSCAPSQYGSTLVSIPAPGTENDDKNPPRIAARSLFDLAIGDDNLFHGDKHRWSGQITVINLANKVALYNFLSTFSGTHYVTPRTVTAQITFNF